MSSFFLDKVVIVTGSSNGIGRAAAKMFAAKGAKVTLTGRNPATLAETKEQCISAGSTTDKIIEVIAEMEEEGAAKKIVDATIAKYGSIDVLVNNAGMAIAAPPGTRGVEVDLVNFDRTMNINVRSILAMVQHAAPYLEKTKGAIINISSIGGRGIHMPGDGFYGMAKAAVDRLTVQHAGELIKRGIRVNAINPGFVVTDFPNKRGSTPDMTAKFYESLGSDPNAIPLGRCGRPDDIANLIVFLADRDLSEFIVGQCIVADGGTMFKNCATVKMSPS